MNQTFEELVVGLIAKNPAVTKKLTELIEEALTKVELGDILSGQIAASIEDAFEDFSMSEIIEKPVKVFIQKVLKDKLGME